MKSTSSSWHGVPFQGVGDGPAIGRSPHRVNSPPRAPMFSAAETGCGTASLWRSTASPGANESMRCHSRRTRTSQGRSRPRCTRIDLHSEGSSSATNTTESSNQPVRRPSQGERCELGQQRPQNGSVVFAGQSPRARARVTAQSHHRREVPTRRPEDNETVPWTSWAPRSRVVGRLCPRTGSGRDRDARGRARQARPRDALGRPLPYGAEGVEPVSEEPLPRSEETIRAVENSWTAADPLPPTRSLRPRWKAGPAEERDLWQGLRRSVSRSPMRPAATDRGGATLGPGGQEVGRICRDRTRHLWT